MRRFIGIKIFLVVIHMAVFSLFLKSSALSDELPVAQPVNRFYITSLITARYNPIGLYTQNRLMYSHRLIDSSSPLLNETFIASGPFLGLTPTAVRVGPTIEVQPLSVFNFRATYTFVRIFGLFKNLQSFDRTDASFSDKALQENSDDAYGTNGHHFLLEPALRMKVGSIAARVKVNIHYFAMQLKGSDTCFYDQPLDTLVRNKKVFFTNDSDLLYIKDRLTLGIRYSGVFTGPGSSHSRIGPVAAWAFNRNEYGAFNRPTLLCALGWYLDHPSRMGPVPYVLAGFFFSSDFINSGK
jgi:hypothetical protein